MKGLKARNFVAVVDTVEEWLKAERGDDKWSEYRKIAFELVIKRFHAPSTLDGSDIEDFSFTEDVTAAKAELQRAI